MNLIPIVLTILVIVFGSIFAEFEMGLLLGLIVGLIALQRDTHLKVSSLRDEIRSLSKNPANTPPQASTTGSKIDAQHPDSIETQASYTRAASIPAKPDRALQSERPKQTHQPAPTIEPSGNTIDSEPKNSFTSLIERIKETIWSYFNDGNLFVRVGLLILFFGVAFLLKYAAENSRIPLEFRFLGAATGGLAIMIAGWHLRNKREIYALLLQGGGIGIIYITIFAAFRIANLIPSILTFALLVVFTTFTAALAVLQNSRGLAIYAILGGFLAPILASSGSGNYIGLFSYYAVLNAAIFIIAWFKSWRLLNLLGFVFTFAVFTLWVIFSYKTTMLLPAIGFLLLFFAMYSLIGTLYALKQSHSLKRIVDGTLVFGTPVIA